jgi:4-amino-4-deoxy-L-arabinose transferase-like glycosyltransferase
VAGARRWPPRPGIAWLAILVAALAVRVAFVATLPRAILWADAQEYEAAGRRLYEQGTYGLQALRPPGYPTLIAAVYHLFGESLLALRLVEAVLAVVSVALIGLIGTRVFGRRAGLIAGALAALHPVLAFLPSTQYSESTLVLVITLGLAATFAALGQGGRWRWLIAGLLLGVATLVRANTIGLFPGLALGLVLALRRARRGVLAPALVFGLGLGLAIAPWMIRDHQVMGRWFFISTGGGRQFWLGNNPAANGSTIVHPVPDAKTQAALDRLPDEFARDRYLYAEGTRYVREHPGRAARLYLFELGNLFALYPETSTHIYVNPWSRVAQSVSSLLVFAGTLVAIVRRRREPALWPLLLASLSFALINSVVLTGMRYRMVIEPCLILMAGAGWAALLGARPSPGNGATHDPRVGRAGA